MTTQQTKKVTIERQPSQERLESLGIFNWPVWTKEVRKGARNAPLRLLNC